MENETVKKIYAMIPRLTVLDKYSIFSTFIFGLFACGYYMTNHIMNYDAFNYQHTDQNMITSGRQFLMYSCLPSSTYDLRWLNCLLALVYLALISLVLLRIFEIKRPLTAILISAFMVTFPGVTTTMLHSYTVDGYMLAALFSILAVYVTKKKWWGFIPGLFMAGFAIGVYQIYYSCTIVLTIMVILKDLLEESDFKKIVNRVVRYLLMGVGSYVFYVVSLKVMLALQHKELSGHQGTDFVNEFPFSSMARGSLEAYKSFVRFIISSHLMDNTKISKVAYWIFLAVTLCLLIYKMISTQMYKNWYRILCMVILVAVLPLGTTIVLVVSPLTYVHSLMRTPWTLIFIFAISLCEQTFVAGKKGVAVFGLTCVSYLCCFIMVFNFSVSSNIAAYTLEQRYERTYALCLRIADRLEKIEGFTPSDKVAIMGGEPVRSFYPETCESWRDIGEYFTACGEYATSSPYGYNIFLKYYIGLRTQTPSDDELKEIALSDDFAEMLCFPNEECIRYINGVWVIKLNG